MELENLKQLPNKLRKYAKGTPYLMAGLVDSSTGENLANYALHFGIGIPIGYALDYLSVQHKKNEPGSISKKLYIPLAALVGVVGAGMAIDVLTNPNSAIRQMANPNDLMSIVSIVTGIYTGRYLHRKKD